MSIGIQIGIQVGVQAGSRIGIGDAASGNPMAGVSQDATSLKYAPATAGEWTITMAAAGIGTGNPSALHLMQEASGDLLDSIGAFPLTSIGTGQSYQQAVAGWTRKAVTIANAQTNAWQSVDAALPNILTTSMLILAYVKPTTLGAQRALFGGGAAATKIEALTAATTGAAVGVCVGNSAAGAIDSGTQVRPWALQINRTAGTMTLYTDAEKLVPTFNATAAGQSISFGAFVISSATAAFLYSATFFVGAAEFSSAQVKTLLTTLGWSGIPWS